MATRIKLCGMYRDEDIAAVVAARPDFVGFIVDFPQSHRSISPERLRELCALLDEEEATVRETARWAVPAAAAVPPRILRVGVLVNQPLARAARIARDANLDFVQLHGNEDRPYVDALRSRLPRGCGIIQAFRMRSAADAVRAEESHADLVLLDAGQGAGEAFDWQLATQVTRPFLLAGGLTPQNIPAAVAAVRPWGVDLSSGIETDRVKDPAKMAAAVTAVHGASSAAPAAAPTEPTDNDKENA